MRGRKRNIFIRDFFEENDKGENKCKSCGMTFIGSYVTNLRRHVVKNHYELYVQHENLSREESVTPEKKAKLTIELSKKEVTNACIEFVTNESLPFSFFDSKPFKTLTEQIFNGLKIPPINSKNIMDFVSEKSTRIKDKIKNKLSGKIISLKVDCATRHDRAILCVNVQFIENKKVIVYTLSMIELHKRHTADNLKSEIENVLSEFGISKTQIYSITSDNGRNIVKAVELLSSADNFELNDIIDENFEDFCESVLLNISFGNVISIRCAAHTLQLAVKDFSTGQNAVLINRARDIIKILRTPIFRYKMEHLQLKKPEIDVITRWSSTYRMLEKLLHFKDFCSENLKSSENLTDEEWKQIEMLVSVLEPLNIATLKLQGTQLIIGEFYKLWLDLKTQMKAINNSLSQDILSFLEKRESLLLNNDTVFAALFLDPRFRRTLTKEKKEAARKHLKKLALQIQSLKNQHSEKQQANPSTSQINAIESSENIFEIDETSMQSSSSLLRQSIREMELDISSSDEDDLPLINQEIMKAYQEIDSFHDKRADIDTDLLEYWESRKYSLPFLRQYALILHAVPATQVSVERAFSALKLVLGDLRYNLSQTNLKTIMFVKLNSDCVE